MTGATKKTAVLLSLAALSAGVVVSATPASAAVDGAVLRIHSSGAVYAGSLGVATAVTTAGGTSTYSIEVANKGSAQGQFLIRLSQSFGETLTLSAGSLITTALAAGPNGYYTAPISAGKDLVFTLKVKTPASASQTEHFFDQVALYDTAGQFLDQVAAETQIKATAGPFVDDIYATGNTGGPVISEEANSQADIADQPIKPAHSASYTVKVQNDSQSTAALRVSASQFAPCGNQALRYGVTVKIGTSDVTPAVVAGTYVTAPLAHGKSTTFTVLVSYPNATIPATCPGNTSAEDQVAFLAFGPNNTASEANLLTQAAAA